MPQIAAVVTLGVVSAVVSAILVEVMRRVSVAYGLVDVPGSRSLHHAVTPRGGGVGIVVVAVTGLVIGMAQGVEDRSALSAYLTAGLIVAIVSLVDDFRTLTAELRLLAQAIGAAILVAGAGWHEIVRLPYVGQWALPMGGLMLTIVWLVGFTNAFNFMDGADGLAASVAVLAGFGWVAIGYSTGASSFAYAGSLLAGASMGFLYHNWFPARIFMGDVGSAFLGFTLAAIPLLDRSNPQFAIAAVTMYWPFVFDTAFTLIRRAARGERLFAAHRTHLYQRLVLSGQPQAAVVRIYIAFTVWSIGATLLWLNIESARVMVFAAPAVTSLFLLLLVRAAERTPHLPPATSGS